MTEQQAQRVQLNTKLGLAEFSLSNTKDPIARIKLLNYINQLKELLS